MWQSHTLRRTAFMRHTLKYAMVNVLQVDISEKYASGKSIFSIRQPVLHANDFLAIALIFSVDERLDKKCAGGYRKIALKVERQMPYY